MLLLIVFPLTMRSGDNKMEDVAKVTTSLPLSSNAPTSCWSSSSFTMVEKVKVGSTTTCLIHEGKQDGADEYSISLKIYEKDFDLL